MDRHIRQIRSVASEFNTREDGEALSIEGYFAVFNSTYNIMPGMSESVAPGAFTDTVSGDVRALINHDTGLVLGRTKAGTLTLRQDERGLWGHIDINPDDSDAMNLYARVKRHDVDQCSFGLTFWMKRLRFMRMVRCIGQSRRWNCTKYPCARSLHTRRRVSMQERKMQTPSGRDKMRCGNLT